MLRTFGLTLATILFAGCGSQATRSIDESADDVGSAPTRSDAARIPDGVNGNVYRFAESSCTEGTQELAGPNYQGLLRVLPAEGMATLMLDESFDVPATTQCDSGDCPETIRCGRTRMFRAREPQGPGYLEVEELLRIAVPTSPECQGEMEVPRPGDLIRQGDFIEFRIQRARVCRGFEVTMSFGRIPSEPLTALETVRWYAAFFTRGDAAQVTELFAETGSLLESFTQTETGDPYRHDGREAVNAWFGAAFSQTPWRALRIESALENENQVTAVWQYMDPRLSAPVAGRSVFTIGAGQIYELEWTMTGTPELAGAAGS